MQKNMTSKYQQQHDIALQNILKSLPKNTPVFFAEFVAMFYAKTPINDLAEISPNDAISLARNAFDFISKRVGNAPKIQIVAGGKHTILQLLNDDMPFLVDSLTAELTRRGFTIYNTIHPILHISRAANGEISGLGDKSAKSESLIHFEISALSENTSNEQLTEDLEFVLAHVRASVEDWQAIAKKAEEAAKNLASKHKEDSEFLSWLVDKNFVFLGYDECDARGKKTEKLGIIKISDEASAQNTDAHEIITISKSSRKSLVHRSVPMDYITVKLLDNAGKASGEARFFGLFTSNVYYQSTEEIPLVRGKVARVLERSDFEPASHDEKALKAILEFLPRDEIFQMNDDELFETSIGILALEAKPSVKIFARKDSFERFISTMIFVPRENFSTDLRRQIQEIIEGAYNGTTASFSTQINEAPLARLHLIIRTAAGDIPAVNLANVEKEIAKRAYAWADLLAEALHAKHDENKAESLARIYAKAFPQSYINSYNASAAVYDIEKIEQAITGGGLALELFRNQNETPEFFHLKIYNPSAEIALSDILPMLENAGFRVIDEHPFLITKNSGDSVWIRDFRLQNTCETPADLEQVKPLLEDALLKIWRHELESDRFNALIIRAGLNYKQVVMLRAYAKYLKQATFLHSESAIEQAFCANPDITKEIVKIFEGRFSPANSVRTTGCELRTADIEKLLASVTNAVHDRIFRRYIDLINATQRTNYFQAEKPVLSFKFASALVPELPKPVPFAEIFVYSPRVEGIHLRGGKVARGGLRWSDRADDFRTEVLGLMKAQMVKNSVIVPVGSKGGFFVKNPPATRDAQMEEGINCYKLYLSGLLDLTDNIIGGKIVPPADLVRHDGDDPYLVVAADKGTASFSDIANSVSAAYNFWLGDAFSSGGSVGYDHKKMAITAKGAFISVRRHFAEMGVDIDKTPFTTVGIGDMAGDVFGNGMLLSENIRLVAAFNHQHIFIDPTPNEKTSFAERKRMFNLPRSSWADYDAKLISQGGGIFERSAKSITISKEAMATLGVDKTIFTPDELIRAIILAPVDLLWNGGIGTYAKAEDETNEQVGDRANNAVRVNGRELRCKIIGEGGNLGFTQKGRIEYAKIGAEGRGGRINTDAIDNSAGVDCSDHEVNIKIAFSSLVSSGKLSIDTRDKILSSMTDEVATLVLKDNILQTGAISIAQAQGADLLPSQINLIHYLENRGILNRAIEFLPTDKQLLELQEAKKGLTRPELAVILSYSKMELYNELLNSSLPDDEYFISDLKRYFPKAMREEFLDAITHHPLKREIIATSITNSLVNRAGTGFAFDIAHETGADLRDAAAAYVIVRDLFGLRDLWEKTVSASDFQIVHKFVERASGWLLRNRPQPLDISAIYKDFAPAIAESKIASTADLERAAAAFDIITISRSTGAKLGKKLGEVEKLYAQIGERFQLPTLRAALQKIKFDTAWEALAAQTIISDLYDAERRLTILALEHGDLEKYCAEGVSRYDAFLAESSATAAPSLSKLTIALKYLRGII